MAKEEKKNLNKDKLEVGAPVSEKDYNRIMAEQRRKNPYHDVPTKMPNRKPASGAKALSHRKLLNQDEL